MNYVSLGGWCGTMLALKQNNLFNEPSLPFDNVRTSMEGIVDCLENNFQDFFPPPQSDSFIGKYVGFYHPNHNIRDENVIASFQRKINRFKEKLLNSTKIIFLRATVRDDPDDEIKYNEKLHNIIHEKYPHLNYIIIFIIPNQEITSYYKNIGSQTFLFTVNDKSNDNNNLGIEYRPIFEYITLHNLFEEIPEPIHDLPIFKLSRVWLVDGHPMVNSN